MGKSQLILSHFPEKIDFLLSFWANHSQKLQKRKSQNGFIRRCGGSRPKFLVCQSFLSKVCQKKFSRSGTPKIDDFVAFFQKSMSEISANWEKTCFSCCRFFRKIEEIGVYFGGCALIIFSQKFINMAGFMCKN